MKKARGRRPGRPATRVHPVDRDEAQASLDAIVDRRRALDDPLEARLSRDLDDAAAVCSLVVAHVDRFSEADLFDAGVLAAWLEWRLFVDERRVHQRRLALAEAVRHKKRTGMGQIDLGTFAYECFGRLSKQAFNGRLKVAERFLRRSEMRPNEYAEAVAARPSLPSQPASPAARPVARDDGTAWFAQARALVLRRKALRFSEAEGVAELAALFEVAAEDRSDLSAMEDLRQHLGYLLSSVDFTDDGQVLPALTTADSDVETLIDDAKRALGFASVRSKTLFYCPRSVSMHADSMRPDVPYSDSYLQQHRSVVSGGVETVAVAPGATAPRRYRTSEEGHGVHAINNTVMVNAATTLTVLPLFIR